MAILTTGKTFGSTDQVLSTDLNNSVNAATFASGAVDGITTTLSSGALIVKNGGITPTKMSTGSPSWDANYNVTLGSGIGYGSVIFNTPEGDHTIEPQSGGLQANTPSGLYHRFLVGNLEKMRVDQNRTYFNTTDGDLKAANAGGLADNGSTVGDGEIQVASYVKTSLYLNRTGSDGVIAEFRKDGAWVGRIITTAGNCTYTSASDYRLKENEVELTGALAKLDAIRPLEYNYKSNPEFRSTGMFAHELQEVVPEAVTGEKDGEEMQGVDYSKVVPLLVAAVKELKAEVEALKH